MIRKRALKYLIRKSSKILSFKIKVMKFWNRSFDENRVEYDLYSDWALSQEKLSNKLKS